MLIAVLGVNSSETARPPKYSRRRRRSIERYLYCIRQLPSSCSTIQNDESFSTKPHVGGARRRKGPLDLKVGRFDSSQSESCSILPMRSFALFPLLSLDCWQEPKEPSCRAAMWLQKKLLRKKKWEKEYFPFLNHSLFKDWSTLLLSISNSLLAQKRKKKKSAPA